MPVTAEWYAWRDSRGTLHVTDQFATIPDSDLRIVQLIPYSERATSAALHAAAKGALATAPEPDPDDPVRAELARREGRLATCQAHLHLLRESAADHTTEQLRQENLLDEEVRSETAAIAQLQQKLTEGIRP